MAPPVNNGYGSCRRGISFPSHSSQAQASRSVLGSTGSSCPAPDPSPPARDPRVATTNVCVKRKWYGTLNSDVVYVNLDVKSFAKDWSVRFLSGRPAYALDKAIILLLGPP